jgi:hypothetical protein
MSSFLDGYESANDTIIRFRKEHPTGRVVTSIQDSGLDKGWVLVKAEIFREYEDTVPSAVDFAYGNVATYPQNMKKWFVEDTVTSCIARAIKLLSPSATRPSREDMARVEYEATPSQNEDDLWATLTITKTETDLSTDTRALGNVIELVKKELVDQPVPQTPVCKHGRMLFKSGNNKTTGKPYEGYTCPSAQRDDQCKPVWL